MNESDRDNPKTETVGSKIKEEQRGRKTAAASAVADEAARTHTTPEYHRSADTNEHHRDAPGMMDALRRGSEEAQHDVANIVPNVSRFSAGVAYGTSYYASYGVVFGALLIYKLIPFKSHIARGIHDGSLAARESFDRWEEASVMGHERDTRHRDYSVHGDIAIDREGVVGA